ncbi:MAG: hypothetical protein CMA29_02525 [Euryarchaeota archaeon]|nr:hypothetical protein [Euryarchaeota archaeon]|tara:strand:- start:7 stop:519 length:513 start_codon:yes stop_codon:yes gene_type:complete
MGDNQQEICQKNSELRKNLINAITEEFSKVDPETGDLPRLESILKMVRKIYEEDMKKITDIFEKKKRDEFLNKFPEEMKQKSIENYAEYYDLDTDEVDIYDVLCSSAGIHGWAGSPWCDIVVPQEQISDNWVAGYAPGSALRGQACEAYWAGSLARNTTNPHNWNSHFLG